MTGYNLLENYTDNLEALLRKNRSRTASSSTTPPVVELVTPVPSSTNAMAKTLRNYSTPAIANVPVGPIVNTDTIDFELRTGLTMMVQASQFYGLPSEDAMHTCNTSLSCATPSSSKTLH